MICKYCVHKPFRTPNGYAWHILNIHGIKYNTKTTRAKTNKDLELKKRMDVYNRLVRSSKKDKMSEPIVSIKFRPAFNLYGEIEIILSLGVLAFRGNILLDNNYNLTEIPEEFRFISMSSNCFNYLIGNIFDTPISKKPIIYFTPGGDRYKITIEKGKNHGDFEWEQCPEEWAELGKVADRLIDFVRSYA